MSAEVPTSGACPFCGRVQAPAGERPWRCPQCNLYVREPDLAAESEVPPLDDADHHFCPWCAFPVAEEYSVPEEGEFPCPGCAGTLTADMLETRAAIDRYRKKGLRGGHYLLFFLALLACIALALSILT